MPTLQFESLAAAWQMAGHGPYVWASYALFVVVLGMLVWAPLSRQRRFLRELREAERRRAARATGSS